MLQSPTTQKRHASGRLLTSVLRTGLTSLALLGTAACSSEDGDSGAQVERSLEIFSWFTAGGEAEALQALIDELKVRHPQVEVTNAAADDPTEARTKLVDRLRAGDPPDSFQVISGVDLFSWVKEERMEPITSLVDRAGLRGAIPEPVLDVVSMDGEVYGIPVNIERDNNLYYNVQLLADHGIEPPKSLADFYAACETLQEEGITPLSLPSAGWVLALVVFETMMPGITGGDFYKEFFNGDANPQDPKVTELFEEFYKVVQCSDVAFVDPDPTIAERWPRWDDAGDRMMDGDAAMFVMGDWAKGYFEGKGHTAIDDFGVVPGLGSDGYFTFNSVVFGLPAGAQHPNAARAWLEVVGSVEGQAGFNAKKGSVPANRDVPDTDFDDMLKGARADFDEAAEGDAKLLGGYATLTPFEFQVAINPALLVFAVGGERAKALLGDELPDVEAQVEAGDMDYILSKIRANYSLVKQ